MWEEWVTQPKMPPLGLDHGESGGVKFREVRPGAIGRHEAVIAAVVGLADGGVDADLGGDTGDDELADALHLQDGVKVGGPEGALPGLSMTNSPDLGASSGMMVWRFAADEDAAHRPGSPMVVAPRLRIFLGGGRSLRSGRWPSRVNTTVSPAARQAASKAWLGAMVRRSCVTSLPSAAPNPPGSKSRCMSMMSSAQAAGTKSKA